MLELRLIFNYIVMHIPSCLGVEPNSIVLCRYHMVDLLLDLWPLIMLLIFLHLGMFVCLFLSYMLCEVNF